MLSVVHCPKAGKAMSVTKLHTRFFIDEAKVHLKLVMHFCST